jgi:phospholipid/cholesterol/gamma-HCH transport system substrate-binding protein
MTRRSAAVGALVAAAVALLVVVLGSAPSHELRAAFTSAVNVVPGQEVRMNGVRVGAISSVKEQDGLALVGLRIEKAGVWPLHRGTRARLRYGTTVSYAARYVELAPGPGWAPKLPSGGLLSTSDTTTPVEFDDAFNVLKGNARADLRQLVDNAAATLAGRPRQLASGLVDAGAGFDQTAELLRRLGDDPYALQALVRAGAATTRALGARDAALRSIMQGGAATFGELANRTQAIGASLERYPPALREAQSTLARLDTSLTGLDGLIGDLAPGARETRRLAGPLRRVVVTLDEVAPRLGSALQATTAAAPGITAFLRQAGPFMQRLAPVAGRLAPMAGCVRSYTPEIAGLLGTWAGYTKNFDGGGHYMRTLLQVPPSSDVEQRTSAQFVAQSPGQRFALVRPPGLNADQPWFLDSCGAGRSALDPAKDPESAAGR